MDHLPTLEVNYRRVGEDRVRQFGLDSAINRLPYDRHHEELAVQSFSDLLRPGLARFQTTPIAHQLPSWSRLRSVNASLQNDLAEAGSADRTKRFRTTMMERPRHPGCLTTATSLDVAA